MKEIIYAIKDAFSILRKKLIIIILFGFIGSVIGFAYAYYSKPVFKAETRFIVKDANSFGMSGSLGSLSNLLGSGISSSIDRAVAIINSERIIGKVLLTSTNINGKDDLVINHFINLEKLKNNSDLNKSLHNVKFDYGESSVKKFSKQQRIVYKFILNRFLEDNGLIIKSYDKKTSIVSFTVVHFDEEFAISVNELIFNQIKNFFKGQASETAYLNVEILSKKVDSIQAELNQVRRRIARSTDESIAILLNADKVDLKSLLMKEQLLTGIYSEAQKNLETFNFVAQTASNSDIISVLDSPFSPLIPISKSKIFYTIIGFAISAILTFGVFFLKHWYKRILD